MIDYLLVVVTHGKGETLQPCLESFRDLVTPAPAFTYFHRDGPVGPVEVPAVSDDGFVDTTEPAVGFCEATRRAWEYAANTRHDYVFWLEHDFVFTRPVDLGELADALDRRHVSLAQMALMRDAVNAEEIAAGGLYEMRRDQYRPGADDDKPPWLEHCSYFTTNPSLMRRSFMYDNPWPRDLDQCEGRFGITLAEEAWSFGVWGDGEPWVRHIGVRDGFGY